MPSQKNQSAKPYAAMKDSRMDRELYYRCPMKWEQLEATRKGDVRHCGACDEKVHFCRTEEDYDRHAAQGHCVAFHPARCGDEVLLTVGQPTGPPLARWLLGIVAGMPTALPSKAFSDEDHVYCHKESGAEE